jgi:endonuclease YncB( thermonuclease family)
MVVRAARLAALVSGVEVTCAENGVDRYGRTLAVCSAAGVPDIGEMLVWEGYAVNYRSLSGIDYCAAEHEARAARRGIWRGTFERPQDWRRRHSRVG